MEAERAAHKLRPPLFEALQAHPAFKPQFARERIEDEPDTLHTLDRFTDVTGLKAACADRDPLWVAVYEGVGLLEVRHDPPLCLVVCVADVLADAPGLATDRALSHLMEFSF